MSVLSFISGIFAAPVNVATDTGITGAISDVTKIPALMSEIWFELSDYRMWRSLGWLLLGVALIAIGIFLWVRTNVIKDLTGVAKVAEVAA